MAVFVSYARPDEPQAERTIGALRASGYEVWWDDQLPAHRAYAEVIEERLDSADAVVVLWSANSVKSQWVRAEADAARNRGTLIQASLDGTIPPLPFNQIHCANLTGDEPASAEGWTKLLGSLQALASSSVSKGPDRPQRHRPSVCILPFTNMSGDPEQEYFSDGITEDITTDLSRISALEVIARNTAFQFKGRAMDVCEIANQLAVSHILEGSVRKARDRVRITAQLIDGRSGGHVWAERYDRDLTDIFAIQDEISHSIVDALKLKLLPEERKAIEQRGTSNVEAYNLYLMARQYWITGNWGDVRQLELVNRICDRTLQVDPAYARVWGLKAIIQCILHFTFSATDDDGAAAADKALDLDPTIAEAYCVRARHHYESGEFEKVDGELAKALELGPDSWEVNREAARIYYFQRRFADSIRHYEKAVLIDGTDYHSWTMLGSAYDAVGDRGGVDRAARMALPHAEEVISTDPTNGAALAAIVQSLVVLGERERAKEWIERGSLINPDNILMRYNFACIEVRELGDPESALDQLEQLVPHFSSSALKAFVADPDFQDLQGHPKYDHLIEWAMKKLSAEGDGALVPSRGSVRQGA
ncbi:MAG TPA: TIR domain-containing protein [Sphingomicrobium sp.]|jgi:adenylate cyclase|nr:TIR domain-containing protein [Sphingomicrobium sp.]